MTDTDETRDDAFRAWWYSRAAAEGLSGEGAVARAFAKVVWVAGYAAGAKEEHGQHLRRYAESLERDMLEQRAKEAQP